MDTAVALPRIRPLEAVPTRQDGKPLFVLRDPFHYSDAVLTLSPFGALIVQLLDGKNTMSDVQAILSKSVNQPFPPEKILEVIRILDECFFLDNENFAGRKIEIEGMFARSPVRPSYLAGRSYPADRAELKKILDELFNHPDPSALDSAAQSDGVVAIVSPHIDFARGGLTYVPAYRAIASSSAETFVIFGVSHNGGATPLVPIRKDFETPLGLVEIDRAVLDSLESELKGKPGWDHPYAGEFSHAFEHSIEFQIVFLQHVLAGRSFRIVPILCAFSHDEVQAERGTADAPIRSFLAALNTAVARSGRKIAYVAGVDFAHVGAQFGDESPILEKELLFHRERDEQMMALIASAGPEEFHRFISEEANTRRVCGYPALYSLLSTLPPDTRTSGRILKYGQWPDPNGTVTFGSLAFSSKD